MKTVIYLMLVIFKMLKLNFLSKGLRLLHSFINVKFVNDNDKYMKYIVLKVIFKNNKRNNFGTHCTHAVN